MKTNAMKNHISVYARPAVEALSVSQDSIICLSPTTDDISGTGHDFSFDD